MLSWLFIVLVAFLSYQAGRYRVHRLQNSGEMLVRRSIQKICAGPNWHLLNNITLPTADGTTQVDHILVSRYGIFIIETKDYSGWIFGEAKSNQWTQVFYKRKFRFQNPLYQNFKHIKTVRTLLDFLPEDQVKGAVIFTGDSVFKTSRPDGVFTLTEFAKVLGELKNEIISENKLQFCVGRLECHRLALTQQTDVEHQQHLQRKFGTPS
jgi:restriction system protein